MIFKPALDIQRQAMEILTRLDLPYIDKKRLAFIRSHGSSSRARARIWAFPTIWQTALGIEPHYVIEVLAEKFDRLSSQDKTRVIIHELLHIPRTFSGALRPHRTATFHLGREANKFYQQYLKNQ